MNSDSGSPPPLLPAAGSDAGSADGVDLQSRFPGMKPIKGPPPLVRLNGFGTAMFGKRDLDPETGTYLKNYGLTLLFIPVLPLSSYRVADAPEGGWYFLGKEPIGGLARMLRITMMVVVALTVLGLYSLAIYDSNDARAERKLKAAAAAASEGDAFEAATKAHAAAGIQSKFRSEAFTAMEGYIDEALDSGSPQTVLRTIYLVRDSPYWNSRFRPRAEALVAISLEQASALAEHDPRMALEFAEFARRSDDRAGTAWVAPMKAALESIAAQPDIATEADIDRLAALYFDLGETAAIIGLLEPRAPFDPGSGLAMHLGLACLREGRPADAAEHLAIFTDERYPRWKSLQESLIEARIAAYDAAIDDLNEGRGTTAFYNAYEKAAESEQEELVDAYAWDAIARDPKVRQLESELEKTGNLPAVMMDLGIACIEAGHAAPPESRDDWFSRAEATFLSLRDHAEDSPDFQFFYGQVCYWLGKSREGAVLFDRLMEEHGEDTHLLVEIATVLRNVGEIDKSRTVFEQALEHAGDDDELRDACIISLSILATSNGERVSYLELGSPANPRIAIDLAEARAIDALDQGDRDTARTLYQEALLGYTKMQENATNLNNAALIHFEIFALGGGPSAYADGLRKMEAALALDPNDSILCQNASARLLASAAYPLLAESIDPDWPAMSRGFADLRLLYDDEAGRDEVLRKFVSHPHYQRGRALLERALILAPENRSLLAEAVGLAAIIRDTAFIAGLRTRIANLAESDIPVSFESWLEMVAESDAESLLEQHEKSVQWYAHAREQFESPRAKTTLDVGDAANRLGMDHWLPDLDTAAIKATLDRAVEEWPCSEFRDVQTRCEYLIAWRHLCEEQPEISDWAGDSLRMMQARDLLILAALRFDDAREHSGLRSALESGLDYARRFSSSYSAQDAVAAEILDSEDQAAISDGARAHPVSPLYAEYAMLFSPHAPSTILSQTWRIWVSDGRESALEAYREKSNAHPWLPVM